MYYCMYKLQGKRRGYNTIHYVSVVSIREVYFVCFIWVKQERVPPLPHKEKNDENDRRKQGAGGEARGGIQCEARGKEGLGGKFCARIRDVGVERVSFRSLRLYSLGWLWSPPPKKNWGFGTCYK